MHEPDADVPAEVAEIAGRYDLSPPITIALHSSGLNDLYRIRSGSGAYMLKLYRGGWRTRAEVQTEVEMLLHLGRKGVAVAPPVAARDGEHAQRVSLPGSERVALLFEEAPGATPAVLDARTSGRYGEALAQLHTAGDDLSGLPPRCDLTHLLNLPLRALDPLLAERSCDRAFVHAFADELRRRIEALPASALDQGLCHGDFRPANGHQEGKNLTLLDFEGAGHGFHAYDLATFLYALSGYGGPSAPALGEAFLTGYAEHRTLSPIDREAAHLFAPLRPIAILGCLLQTSHKNRDLEPWPLTETRRLPGLFDTTLAFLRESAKERGFPPSNGILSPEA